VSSDAATQTNPAIAMDASGDFVIVWDSNVLDGSGFGVFAQRYTANGQVTGGEFRVNTYTQGDQSFPAAAMGASGNFVITWQSDFEDSFGKGIFARRFDTSGNANGSEFQVNSYTNSDQSSPTIGISTDGDFVIAWQSNGQDGNSNGIFAQRYDSSGVRQSGEFQVNTFTVGDQNSPSVSLDDAGDFVIAWNNPQGGNPPADVYAQRYNAAGLAEGSEFRVNTFATGDQSQPAVVMFATGDFGIAWTSFSQGGGRSGIFAQRFEQFSNRASAGNFVWNDVDGNGIQDPGEPGIDGVTINLLNSFNSFVDTTTTTGGGRYRFDNLAVGRDYRIQVLLPQGQMFAHQDQGGDDALDSDVDPTTGISSSFSVSINQPDLTRDAGLVSPASINGTLFNDLNNNDVLEAGEPGRVGWVVAVDLNSNGVVDPGEPISTTGFSFTGLFPGVVNLIEVPQDHWTPSYPPSRLQVKLKSGQATAVALGSHTDVPDLISVPVGGPTLANTTANAGYNHPAVAMSPNGDYVVTWDMGSSDYHIYAQQYSAAGAATGSQFRVNTYNLHTQDYSAVASSSGSFVVIWDSNLQDGSGHGIYGQLYTSAGAAIGSEFRANTTTVGDQDQPAVAMDAAGNFVVTWMLDDPTHPGIFGQRFDAAGLRQGPEFRVDTIPTGSFSVPTVAMDAIGGFVVVWQSVSGDSDGYGILAQRFSSDGTPIGSQFRVNTATSGNQLYPSIAMDPAGDFIIAWQTGGDFINLVPGFISFQRYNAAGIPQGIEQSLSSDAPSDQQFAQVAMDATGDFTIVWRTRTPDPFGVPIERLYGQRYNAAGLSQGGYFAVSPGGSKSVPQQYPAVAMDKDGNFVVAWHNDDRTGTQFGVLTQRFAQSSKPGSVGDLVWQDLNGDGLHDPNEPTIDGVKVSLFNLADLLLASTVTASGGNYRFDNLVPGVDYYLQFTAPPGLAFTRPDAGADDLLDSDVDPHTGRTATFLLSPSQINTSIDAGLATQSSIGGTIYADANSNVLRDAGETGLAGWTVFLDANADGLFNFGEPIATTDTNGAYLFSGLGYGPYHVSQVTQSYWVQTTPLTNLSVTLTPGQDLRSVDIGDHRSGPAISIVPQGVESRVNVSNLGEPFQPAIAINPQGNYVVAWSRSDPNGSSSDDVLAKRFNASGVGQGNAFIVNSTTQDSQKSPAVAMSDNNGFVVTWASTNQDNSGVEGGDGIYAQRYAATGSKAGSAFRVNTTIYGDQNQPAIAMDHNGDFVIAWSGRVSAQSNSVAIYAQRYNSAGVKQGTEIKVQSHAVSSPAASFGFHPAIAMNNAGDFVVAWESLYQDTPDSIGIYAQQFNAAGLPVGGEFLVNTTTALNQENPAIAMDAVGNFVIAWRGGGLNGVEQALFARHYNAGGHPLGDEFPASPTDHGGFIYPPAVIMDSDGTFVIAWPESVSGAPSNIRSIHAQQFSVDGQKVDGIVIVNPHVTSLDDVALAGTPRGDFVAAWISPNVNGGARSDIFTQSFAINFAPTTSGIADVTVDAGSAPTVVDMFPAFADTEDADSKLTYTFRVSTPSDPTPIQSLSFDGATGLMTLNYAPGIGGFANILVRATDTGGAFVESTFTVTVRPPIPLSIDSTPGDDNIHLRVYATQVSAWINHDPASQPADVTRTLSTIDLISLHNLGGNDSLSIEITSGGYLPPKGLTIDVGSASTAVSFLSAATGQVTIAGTGNAVFLTDAIGADLLVTGSGSVEFATTQHLHGLNLVNSSRAMLRVGADILLRTNALFIDPAATLDLADNDLILRSTGFSSSPQEDMVRARLASGRRQGTWNGPGIISSVAASNPGHLTGMAELFNQNSGVPIMNTFDGEPVDANVILLKFTYNGDTDLNGKIDSDDYFNIDRGLFFQSIPLTPPPTYRFGDFDFNGRVDADDYFLIDRAFAGQTSVLAAHQPATWTASRLSKAAGHRRARHHRSAHR
jgi:hypothetical protein